MTEALLFTLTVLYSIITGTAAGLLSLQTWEILRRSPFGRAVFFLSLVMLVFIVYHVFLLLVPSTPLAAKLMKSAMLTGVALFIGLMIWSQHKLRARAALEVRPG